ncbi:hypothetical protein SteCoe_3251 [Stentor coeruleus]|uniref:Uncharacterized protein n=1 Tax=Stentor coeruleus TaxID=5963 RepID=A0A1R2CXF4_9CILI|nr:hypothetical protein SteCoe_3251 [Stentor coeruleus]
MSSNVSSIRLLNNEVPELDLESIVEIHMTLEQMKPVPKTAKVFHKQSPNIEDQLLKKHLKSQAKLSEKRIKKKSQELENITPVPRISAKSTRLSLPRYKSEVKMMIQSSKKSEPETEEIQIRPQDSIPGPDLGTIKQSFSARGLITKISNPTVNPFKLTLIEKTKFFLHKKISSAENAKKKKAEELQKQCTFKPKLEKSTPKHKRSAESLPECLLTEGGIKANIMVRPPAPNPRVNREKSLNNNNMQKTSLKENYNQISPAKGIYGFKEGVNLKQLIEKSKPLIKYSVVKNY